MSKQHVQVPNKTGENITSETKHISDRKHYTDLLIYACIKRYMDKDTGISIIGFRKVAEKVGFSTNKVQSAVKRLIESGDIEKIKMPNKNQNGYRFNKNSEKFEMFDNDFLDNEELTPYNKAFMIAVQKYLYIDKESGIGKTTYSTKELSTRTGLSEKVINERRKELESLGFISRRLTQDKEGNSCEALEFNLPKFGQYVLCKLEEHDEDINKLKQENTDLKLEMNKIKYIVKEMAKTIGTTPAIVIDENEIKM